MEEFNSADVAVAGRFAESGALAAVGSNSVLAGLFVNLFVGLSVGANVIIAQYIGQKRMKDVGTVVFRLFWVYVIFPLWNSFEMFIIVYPVSWALTGGMVVIYYISQRKKPFVKRW